MPIRYHSQVNRQKLKQQYGKRERDPLLDLDSKVRDALAKNRDRYFKDDWRPRVGSEDEALLITYGMTEFIQGIVEEEDRFKKSWEER